eukprot:6254029-Pyramimonas_sp.AAC.2
MPPPPRNNVHAKKSRYVQKYLRALVCAHINTIVTGVRRTCWRCCAPPIHRPYAAIIPRVFVGTFEMLCADWYTSIVSTVEGLFDRQLRGSPHDIPA